LHFAAALFLSQNAPFLQIEFANFLRIQAIFILFDFVPKIFAKALDRTPSP